VLKTHQLAAFKLIKAFLLIAFLHDFVCAPALDGQVLGRAQGALLGLAVGDSLGVPGENIHADAGRTLVDPTKNPP
jgi:hypothetical protein